ncbi:hypothetical protein [Microvirga arabica]|uniref:hypothetical protein n=1 Tax=Microvirga arabica TaxID=1128671 RepID=UPI0035E42A02
MFAHGISPRAIARRLYEEHVPAPDRRPCRTRPSAARRSAAPAFSTTNFIFASSSGTAARM